MDDSSQSPQDATPGAEDSGDVAAEFSQLGEHLKTILKNAWESPERKKLQQEIETGLNELGKSLNQAAYEFKESPAGQRLKSDTQDLHDRIRSGEVEGRLRDDLLSILRRVNTELEKAAAHTSSNAERPPGMDQTQ